jgi:hypothetical protein
MPPERASVERLIEKLRIDTPIIALYDSEPSGAFEPLVKASGRTCCFAYYKRWLKGETLVIERGSGDFLEPDTGCNGAQIAFGLKREYPPFMANFLTDGRGAPMGEGLKATPELAQEFIDRAVPPSLSSGTVLIGPLRIDAWEKVKSITFLVDPDRLSALMTLAGYWTADPEVIHAPFSSGCGLLWRELEAAGGDRAVIGCTDIAMRKYLPPEILCFTVSPTRFERMVDFPDGCFLTRSWWNDLMDSREKKSSGNA